MKWTIDNQSPKIIWKTQLENKKILEWKGFGVGPLTLTNEERENLCEKLLQADGNALKSLATEALLPFEGEVDTSLILHSTTADLGAFQGDLTKLKEGKHAKNYAGYVETRAPFLGKAGDLTVGRMQSWKKTALTFGLELVELPNLSHYYLSDVLLMLAEKHLTVPQPTTQRLIDYLQEFPHTVVRLYVLDKTIQIFLVWLKRMTGLEKIYIDANSPEVAETWNKKNILYPTVALALQMNLENLETPYQILAAERKETILFQKLGLDLDGLPGYVIQRKKVSLTDFCHQTLAAAQLLQERYGLQKACLKASESGDGARITPNIDLTDTAYLTALATTAHTYGDDYVLESHVEYSTTKAGNQTLTLTPSVHIRSGKMASGITLQFTKGTSWVGNLFINEQLSPRLGISVEHYQSIRQTMSNFLMACKEHNQGLAIAGMDFAIGQVGGKFGGEVLLGVQDPNISFNGAEFLREFMKRVGGEMNWEDNSFFAVTWVFVPSEACTHDFLVHLLETESVVGTYSMAIAVVPESWGMIGVAALEYSQMLVHLEKLKASLGGGVI